MTPAARSTAWTRRARSSPRRLLLTPGFPSASSRLIYSAEYNDQQGQETMFIHVCNPTDNAINDQTTDFNLLVIDAQ